MKRIVALMLLVVLTQPLVFAQKHPKTQSLSEDQRIIHVLNRLGFGARPGDVERVKAMGVEKYIEQQLNPEKIPDTVAENKVRELSILSMTTAELYEKYPQPGQLRRQLQARGKLPAEMADDAPKNNQGAPPANLLDNEKNRQAIQEYYRENGLQRPQRIIDELQASRIVRAVYSERQLQEVMVDFWTNHFNIFANKGADRWLLPAWDRDTIRPNAMGKFSTLLQATAQSPAMLFYLDNFQSVSPNANREADPRYGARRPLLDLLAGRRRRDVAMDRDPNMRRQQPAAAQPQRQRRGINENYARELM